MQEESGTSIRTHVLAIVLGTFIPLALLGAWQTRSAMRSGEALLGGQLDSALAELARSAAVRWDYRRGDLLLLSNSAEAHRVFATRVAASGDARFFARWADTVSRSISRASLLGHDGRELLEVRTSPGAGWPARDSASPPRPVVTVRLPVDDDTGAIGQLEADVFLDALVADSTRVSLPGAGLAIRDRGSRVTFRPVSGEIEFPVSAMIATNRGRWLARVDSINDSPIDVAVAAPLAQFVDPFVRAGEQGLLALVAIAVVMLLVAVLLSARLTASFRRLVDAAGFVASGDLSRTLEPRGPRELRQISSSFNAMTESLRRLVKELSDRRALAAVGEFATEQSHEVRNALTSVQLYLERVDERSEDVRNKEMLARTLEHVRRLDAAVTGSLRVARSGRVAPADIDMREVVREAIRRAAPNFLSANTLLAGPAPDAPVMLHGDAEALQQLLLNVLLNAQQELPAGGQTIVSIESADTFVEVAVVDNGPGMTDEQAARAFEPFYTTRPNGTGLGLSISRQIATAHGGTLTIESMPGLGAIVRLRIPR